jgi:integrase/recombinase XerD
MPQKPVRRRVGNRYTPATRPAFKPRLIADWAGWDAAVIAMIQERGPDGARAFGQGQADNYRWILQGERNRLWREENEILAPEDVTPERVERLKQDLLGEAEMRPASAQQYVKNLKTFLRWCRTTGFVIDPEVLEVPNVDPGDGEPPDPFSEEEIARLERAAPTPARKLFVRFAWRTGLRVSEIERANIDDVGQDSHGPVLQVPFAAAKPSRRWRVVPLDTKTTRFSLEIRRYLLHDRGIPYSDPDDPEGTADAAQALFLNEEGKRWRAAGIQSFVRRLGATAGVEHPHVHRFRHTFGTWCARRGMNHAQIMAVGGWRTGSAAMGYIKLAAADAVKFFQERAD